MLRPGEVTEVLAWFTKLDYFSVYNLAYIWLKNYIVVLKLSGFVGDGSSFIKIDILKTKEIECYRFEKIRKYEQRKCYSDTAQKVYKNI